MQLHDPFAKEEIQQMKCTHFVSRLAAIIRVLLAHGHSFSSQNKFFVWFIFPFLRSNSFYLIWWTVDSFTDLLAAPTAGFQIPDQTIKAQKLHAKLFCCRYLCFCKIQYYNISFDSTFLRFVLFRFLCDSFVPLSFIIGFGTFPFGMQIPKYPNKPNRCQPHGAKLNERKQIRFQINTYTLSVYSLAVALDITFSVFFSALYLSFVFRFAMIFH